MAGSHKVKFYHHAWLDPKLPFVAHYPAKLVPNLLATCKTVNAEATAIFWTQPFYVADLATMHAFLYRIGPATMTLMRDVTLIAWPRTQHCLGIPVFNLLRAATNLESLTVFDQIFAHSWRIPSGEAGDSDRAKYVAKKLYREIFPWIEAVMRKDGGGIERLEKVLRINEDNLKPPPPSIYAPPSPEPWTAERWVKCEEIMFQELARIVECDHK